MIVVDTTNQNRTIDLKDFFTINGLINTYGLSFEWKKDHGVINGKEDQINKINDIFNKSENLAFTNFKILRKWDYDYVKCTTPFQKPCPYYYTALASLMIPTALALLCFLIMTCCSCCMKGM
jgi:hypothetical protein